MIGTFRKRLKAGETLLGSMVTLPVAAVAEILADVGFDWLFIDGEHGPLETGRDSGDAAGGRRPDCVHRPRAGGGRRSDQEDPRPGRRGDHRPSSEHGRTSGERRAIRALFARGLARRGACRGPKAMACDFSSTWRQRTIESR